MGPCSASRLRPDRGPRRVAGPDRRYLSEASMAQLTPQTPTSLEHRPENVSEVIDQPALQTA